MRAQNASAPSATPVAGGVSDANWGQSFGVPALVQGQVITARQTLGATTSGRSDPVTVRSHTVDYPTGIPRPRIDPTPLYACGRATGVRDVVPGSRLTVQSEKAVGGGFDPPVKVGEVNGSGAAQAVGINPPFEERARITAQYAICSDRSQPSAPQIAQRELSPLPQPTLDPVYENATTVVVRAVTNGAVVDVFSDGVRVGGQASSGGAQAVGINPPAAAGKTITASQKLCGPGTGDPGTVVQPCSALPPAKIRTPMVGDTRVEVTEFVQGSRIVIRVNNQEIGDGGGPVVQLTRPLLLGEQVVVVQWLGHCQSQWIYVVEVACVSPRSVADPSAAAATDFQVGSDDYSLPAIPIGADSVRLFATVRYPADAPGARVALAKGGRPFPLVVFLHGNHGIVRVGSDDFCDGRGDPNVPVQFTIGLEDNSGLRSDVPTQSVGRIPYPYAHPTHPKSMMRTLRIPYACFRGREGAVRVDDVKALHFTFRDPTKGVVGLDQIQFCR